MKRRLAGKIISDQLDKTRVVEIVRDVVHPLYKKRYKVSKRFYAHDAGNTSKTGDRVIIEEIRPLSKLKRWKIVERITSSAEPREEVAPASDEKKKSGEELAAASPTKKRRPSRKENR